MRIDSSAVCSRVCLKRAQVIILVLPLAATVSVGSDARTYAGAGDELLNLKLGRPEMVVCV